MSEKKTTKPKQVVAKLALEDLPTYVKVRNMHSVSSVMCSILKFFHLLGFCRSDKWTEIIALQANVETQFQQIDAIMQFNKFFLPKGWVAYESLDIDLMHQAVILAQQNCSDEAESKLVEFFNEKNIRGYLKKFNYQVLAFNARNHLLELALEDYTVERYHACIPVVLMMLDGIINDVNPEQKSGDTANVTAWDSLAGHPMGLESLYRQTICRSRNRTTSEPICLPFRNGIIHGRDLGYANQIVAAKAWSALFAVGDWAIALKSEKVRKEKHFEKQPEMTEVLKNIGIIP